MVVPGTTRLHDEFDDIKLIETTNLIIKKISILVTNPHAI
jgi:hypothetical protein